MTLGEKIYNLRTEKGYSQETLGEKLGVSRQSVSKWETDQSMPMYRQTGSFLRPGRRVW